MTALKQFARLETTGLWRPAPEDQRREVVVAMGEATLTLADGAGRPLTHWSLAALVRLNPDESPARYSPDEDLHEELEIEDPLMIAALDKIRGAIDRAQPHPGFLRRRSAWLVFGGLALAAALWLPDALTRQALALVPDPTRTEIGATMVGLLQHDTGRACREGGGPAALDRLATRLYGPGSGLAIVILPRLPAPVALPGGLIALPETALTAHDDPFVFAGEVLATLAATEGADPLRPALDRAGMRATLTLLATGRLSATALEPFAKSILQNPPAQAGADTLLAAFGRAGVPVTPWAYARDPSGESVLDLIEADQMAGQSPAPVMSDADWVTLQGICG